MARKETYATNPITGEKIYRTQDVLVYGISDEEFAIICEELPKKDIRVVDCSECFTDIIALPYIAVVINPDVMEQEHVEYFNEFADEVLYFSEKIIFTKNHPILSALNKNVKHIVLDGEFELKAKIKYLLLEATRSEKRNDKGTLRFCIGRIAPVKYSSCCREKN